MDSREQTAPHRHKIIEAAARASWRTGARDKGDAQVKEILVTAQTGRLQLADHCAAHLPASINM